MAAILDKLKKFSSGPRRFVAVDFDGRQLRVVHAERVGDRTRVLKLAAVAMPEGYDVEDPKDIGRLLAATLKDMRLKNVGVLMNVTRAEAVLKPVSLPPGAPQAELAGMVQFQVEKELPFRAEEAVVDFTVESHYDVDSIQSADTPAPGVAVLVGAVRLPVVDHYRQIAEAAGVQMLRLGLRPYANMRCVDACTKRRSGETVMIVHFGADETEIDMLVGNSLSFSRSVVAKIPIDGEPHQLAQSVRTVAAEVVRSVQSFQAVERSFTIDAILVAGGTGVEAVAGEELATRLGAPYQLFNPTAALGLGEVENPSAFISALGLAIGHRGADQLPFDFLNPKRPPVQRNWPKIAAIAGAAVFLLFLSVGVTAGTLRLNRKAAAVASEREKYDKQAERKRDLAKDADRVKRITEWQDERRGWLKQWVYISSLFPSCSDAYVNSLKTSSDGSLTFTVNARESKIITEIGERLTEGGYSFQPGRLATTKDAFGYPYSADVRVFVDADMAVDLTSVKPVPRPEDDDSIKQMMQIAMRSSQAPSSSGSGSPSSPSSRSGSSGSSGSGSSGGSSRYGSPSSSGSSRYGSPSAGSSQRPSPGGSSSSHGGGAPSLTPAARMEVRRYVLEKYDRNKNGEIDDKEYSKETPRRIAERFEKYFDTNRNGRVDSSEYRGIYEFLKGLR